MVDIDDDPFSEEWYYCLDHKEVEPELGCRAEVRLGPYATEEEAAAALERSSSATGSGRPTPPGTTRIECVAFGVLASSSAAIPPDAITPYPTSLGFWSAKARS